MKIYGFIDYKEFIKYKIKENVDTRGYQTRLSEAAGCHLSYLSHVITTHVHLTPEHAAGLTAFWHFTPKESEYFILIVNLGRSNDVALRQILERRRKEIVESVASVASRIEPSEEVSLADQNRYYSSWLYAAIHILISLTDCQTIPGLASRLHVLPETISNAVDELKKIGVIESKGEKLRVSKWSMHISPASPMCQINHSNWRHKAVNRMQTQPQSEDLHYTAVYSLSKKDCAKMREMLFDTIKQTRELAGPSAEEEVIYLGIDLFTV